MNRRVNSGEMAEMRNQYFASVFTVEDTSTIPIGTGKSEVIERVELGTINIDREKVLSELLGLRTESPLGLMAYILGY